VRPASSATAGSSLAGWGSAISGMTAPSTLWLSHRRGRATVLALLCRLCSTGSTVIHDIKVENWQLTAGWRARFSHCLLFNPTDVRSARYNPLLEVRRGGDEVRDKVDFHTWQLLKGIVLSTLLGVGSELALSGQSDLVQAIRTSTQDNVARAGDQITQRNLGIQPTITIRPGAPVRLIVHKDLVLVPPGKEG
jgi:hypothetical protein